MRLPAALALTLTLAACGGEAERASTPTPATPVPVDSTPTTGDVPPGPATASDAAKTETPAALTLSPDGVGPLRIGMTFAQADAALGAKLNVGDDYSNGLMACNYGSSTALPGVAVMVDGGKVVRFDVKADAPIRSDRGIAEGDPVAKVLAAYPEGLKREPHHYVEAPGHYLEWFNADRSRGIRYEIDQQGVVSSMYSGAAPNVGYVEGCS